MECISLHGYIRNTPSDTEVLAEHQLSGQEHLTSGKEYTDPWETRQDKGTRGKTRVLVGLALPSAGGGMEAGV